AAAAVASVGDERAVNRPFGWLDNALDDGKVRALDRVSAEEALKRPEGLGRANKEDHAGRELVDPMNDTDLRVGGAALVAAVAAGTLQEGLTLAVGSRLGQKAGGFVDDEDIAVFEKHAKPARDRFRPGPARVKCHLCERLNVVRGVEACLSCDVDLPA